jgi:hypothetical protein
MPKRPRGITPLRDCDTELLAEVTVASLRDSELSSLTLSLTELLSLRFHVRPRLMPSEVEEELEELLPIT